MVDHRTVEKQLKRIKFDSSVWNRAETRELQNILLPDEVIKECANGIYENGFALLIATDLRLLLIDKKPMNFLTVEDLRFDMITELDYSHRLLGATITISAGSKTLKFKSYNQARLRTLISHVQHRMAEIKKQQADKVDNQQQHLEDINKQLQMYLLAQQQQLQQQIQGHVSSQPPEASVVKPSPQLSDYLFAQRLLEQFASQDKASHQAMAAAAPVPAVEETMDPTPSVSPSVARPAQVSADQQFKELAMEGQKEIFGKVLRSQEPAATSQPAPAVPASNLSNAQPTAIDSPTNSAGLPKSLEINALRIAYSKLPMMLRNRKFGRPSLLAHSQAPSARPAPAQTQPAT